MAKKDKPESAAVKAFKEKWGNPKKPFPNMEEKALQAAEERNEPGNVKPVKPPVMKAPKVKLVDPKKDKEDKEDVTDPEREAELKRINIFFKPKEEKKGK